MTLLYWQQFVAYEKKKKKKGNGNVFLNLWINPWHIFFYNYEDLRKSMQFVYFSVLLSKELKKLCKKWVFLYEKLKLAYILICRQPFITK